MTYSRLFSGTIVAVTLFLAGAAQGSEYCINRFDNEIRAASVELANTLQRQLAIEKRVTALQNQRNEISGEIGKIIAADPDLKDEENRKKVRQLSEQQASLKIEQDKLEVEGHDNNARVVQLRTAVPAEVQGRLKGCLAAVTPVNKLVNFSVQAIALIATAGLSTQLPEKALYVDMGEVLHGKPLGGDGAALPKARDDILKGLGISGDAEKILKDPKCIFGGC